MKEYLVREKLDHKYNPDHMEKLATAYRDFKLSLGVYDYNDMISFAATGEYEVPKADYLFVDECQDLSPTQWHFVNRIAEFTKENYLAGDDKQSINQFAGADSDTFSKIDGKIVLLQQSYRCSRAIHTRADHITRTHMKNYRKETSVWQPRDCEGEFLMFSGIPFLKIISTPGTWFLQCRTKYQYDRFIEGMFEPVRSGWAIPFGVEGKPPVNPGAYSVYDLMDEASIRGIKPSEMLRIYDTDSDKERSHKVVLIQLVKKFISGYSEDNDQPWQISDEYAAKIDQGFAAVDKLSPLERRYVELTWPKFQQEGLKMFEDAKIQIGTIHKFKGREADHTCVLGTVTNTIMREIEEGTSDIEAKITYTAITRARDKCWFVYGLKPKVNLDKYIRY